MFKDDEQMIFLYKCLSEYYKNNTEKMNNFLTIYSICSDLFYMNSQVSDYTDSMDKNTKLIGYILKNWKIY